ncbi:MAG: hypothetical protein P1V97_18855 [Planctomycetota bacterium]|nr:hypothetical protein [Planctomycetota bacterium]
MTNSIPDPKNSATDSKAEPSDASSPDSGPPSVPEPSPAEPPKPKLSEAEDEADGMTDSSAVNTAEDSTPPGKTEPELKPSLPVRIEPERSPGAALLPPVKLASNPRPPKQAAAPKALDESDEGEEFEAPLSAQAAVQLLEKEIAEGKKHEPTAPMLVQGRSGQGLTFFGQLLIAAALLFIGISLNKEEPEKPYVPSAPVKIEASPLAAAQSSGSGQLTPFGTGKALYSDGQGRFLIMVLNPGSGELVVEKALELVYDPTRLHESAERKDHHYYFEDIVRSRKDLLKNLRDEFSRLAASGRTDTLTLDRLLNLARRISRFHDVKYLLPFLKHQRFFVRQAVALGLGEQGYRIALKELIFSMDTGDVEFRRQLRQTLKDLTGVDFLRKPEDPEQKEAMETARKWLRRHPQGSPYAVGHALQEKQEGRINRGL